MRSSRARTVVLVGGGHTHVQVLRSFAMDPPKDVRLRVVLDRPVAVYSGMVPGFVAGDYRLPELEIDVVPLARRAGAGVVLEPALDIDPVRQEILFANRAPLRFDFASLDVGSTVRGLELPGVREFALATRPIGDFVLALDARLEALAGIGRAVRVIVVGGGAAGTELAFTLEARLRASGVETHVTVVAADSVLLPGAAPAARAKLTRAAAQRGIDIHTGDLVRAVHRDGIEIDDEAGTRLPADLVVWAAGAAPSPFPAHAAKTALACDASGFIEVRSTLQTRGFDHVFAVGDCARTIEYPWVPRAGVYAVRQGPVLTENLRASLEGRTLRAYRPQRDFLSILNLGGGRALASKWGSAIEGAGVLRLKDWIDRRFMRLFQVVDEHGAPIPELERLGAMGSDSDSDEEMACGGCAAKLGALPLESALAALPPAPADASVVLGLAARDDVAATIGPDRTTLLHNVDVIRAFSDDPYVVGEVAAANALSDLQAKGGRPRHAQAIIGLPDLEPNLAEAILFETLSGVRAHLDAHGVSLIGGHTTIGDQLTVGLSVSGEGPPADELMRQTGARAGDALVLTQPIGIGVVLAADMRGLARGEWVLAAQRAMTHSNREGGEIARSIGIDAATDVTGFGLGGHLLTLLRGGELDAELDRAALPFLPGAAALWNRGIRSTAHPANEVAFGSRIEGATTQDSAWLFDPQTAGGLLLAVPQSKLAALRAAFERAGQPPVFTIGRLVQCEASDPGRSSLEPEVRRSSETRMPHIKISGRNDFA